MRGGAACCSADGAGKAREHGDVGSLHRRGASALVHPLRHAETWHADSAGRAEELRRSADGKDCGARGKNLRGGGRGIQYRIPETARRGSVRSSASAGRKEDKERLFDGSGRSREALCRLPHCRQCPRIPGTYQAQEHLCRRALRLHRTGSAHPHDLQSDRDGDGTHFVRGSEPSEHPDAHRAGKSHPQGIPADGGIHVHGFGLLADRASHPRLDVRGSGTH